MMKKNRILITGKRVHTIQRVVGLLTAIMFSSTNVQAMDLKDWKKDKKFQKTIIQPLKKYKGIIDPSKLKDAYKIKVRTSNDGVSNNRQFTIPAYYPQYNSYLYNVDCDSDGRLEAIRVTDSYTCEYYNEGDYTISITGTYERNTFDYYTSSDNKKLIEVVQWGKIKWRSMAEAFAGCSNMTMTATDAPNLTEVTSMSGMFKYATRFNQDISHWDTSAVTDMRSMFTNAISFNQDISSWDTGAVTDMDMMFFFTIDFAFDLSNWNVQNVATHYSFMWPRPAGSANEPNWTTD